MYRKPRWPCNGPRPSRSAWKAYSGSHRKLPAPPVTVDLIPDVPAARRATGATLSGRESRELLDQKLREAGISSARVRGYDRIAQGIFRRHLLSA
jgi:hypothetical protein